MNRLTRILVATVIGYGMSRVVPEKALGSRTETGAAESNRAAVSTVSATPAPATVPTATVANKITVARPTVSHTAASRQPLRAYAQIPVLHPIVVGVLDAPTFKWSKPHTPYLDSMRARFDLDGVTAGARTDYDRVRALSHWARTRWEHNGANEARHSDPVGILDEASAGQQFRCVEYAIVLSGALNAVGMPSRVVNLKTADSETRPSGAGHVVAEAYLRDAARWVMVDGQWDMIPWVKGKPASALELKKALEAKSASITYTSMSGTKPAEYSRWIAPYLYYMDAKLDQRVGVASDTRALMLVPQGGKAPRVFQRKLPLKNMIYTTAAQVFYPRIPVAAAKPVVSQRLIPGRPLAANAPRALPRTAG